MTIRQDSSSIISIQSHRGVDTSASILQTPEGFCREMENCDISTAGIIKKRPGYVTHGGQLPVLYNGSGAVVRRPGKHFYYRDTVEVSDHSLLGQTRKLYNWVTLLPLLRQEYNIDAAAYAASILSSGYFFGYQMLESDAPITMNHLFPSSLNVEGKIYEIAPVAIIGRYVIVSYTHCIIWRESGVLPSTWTKATTSADIGVFPTAVGYVFPVFDSTTITSVVEVVKNATDLQLKFNTTKPLPVNTKLLLQGVGLGEVTASPIGGNNFTASFGPNVVTDFVPHLGYPTGLDIDFTLYTEDFCLRYLMPCGILNSGTYAFGDLFGDNHGYFDADAEWVYGTGASSGDVQTVETFYNKDTGLNELVCVQNGTMFRLNDTQPMQVVVDAKTYSVSCVTSLPPALGATSTLDKISGVYRLPFPNASTYYQVGDTIIYALKDSAGDVISQYSFILESIETITGTVYMFLSTEDTNGTVVFNTGSTLNYTRSSAIVGITLVTTPYSFITQVLSGDVIFFGGYGNTYPAHELRYIQVSSTPYLVFPSTVTYSGGQTLYAGPRWEVVPWETENYIASVAASTSANYGMESYPFSSEIIPSTRFDSSAWFTSNSDGIMRFNGKDSHSLVMLRPEVESIRSIPGSVGKIKLTSDPLQFIFIFSARDSMNNLIESETSLYDNTNEAGIVFRPNEAKTSSTEGLGEVIEFRISPPVVLARNLSGLKLDVYMRFYYTNSQGVTTTSDFSKYRSVPATPGLPVVVRVGDLSANEEVATAQRAYSLVENNNQPSLYSKYVTSVSNRLVAMNCKTYEHIKLLTKKIYREKDNAFGAYFKLTVPMRDPDEGLMPVQDIVPGPIVTLSTAGGGIVLNTALSRLRDEYWIVSFCKRPPSAFPANVTEEIKYFYNPTSGKISTTLANAVAGITVTVDHPTVMNLYYWGYEYPELDFTITGGYVATTWASSGVSDPFNQGMQVTVSGSTLPAELVPNVIYYAYCGYLNVVYLSIDAASSAAGIYIAATTTATTNKLKRVGFGYTSNETIYAVPLSWASIAQETKNVTYAELDPNILSSITFADPHGLVWGQGVTFAGAMGYPYGVSGAEYFAIPLSATVICVAETLSKAMSLTGFNLVLIGGTKTCTPSPIKWGHTDAPGSTPLAYPYTESTLGPWLNSTKFSAYSKITSATTSGATITAVKNTLSLTYTDASMFANVSTALTLSPLTPWKFRTTSASTTVPATANLFLTSVFPTTSYQTSNQTILLPEPWRDSALNTDGTPTSLVGVQFVGFLQTGVFTLDEVKAKKVVLSVASTTSGTGTDGVRSVVVALEYLTAIAPVAESDVIVLQGPGTCGNLNWVGNTSLLSFEKDLTFLVGPGIDGSTTVGTTGYTKHILTPVNVTETFTTTVLNNLTCATAVAINTNEFPITIFKKTNELRTFSGMSIPSTSLTIKTEVAATSVLATTSVGDYITFVMSFADKLRPITGFPDVTIGSFYVLSVTPNTGGYDSITIKVSPSKDQYLKTGSETLNLSGTSYCVNLSKLITPVEGGFRMPLAISGGPTSANYAVNGGKAFVVFRGAEYGSACFQLSGWYYASPLLDTGVWYTTFKNGTNVDIDYSAITGIECSAVVICQTAWPVPMPAKLGLAESLVDLAMPIFSRDSVLTDNALAQVGRRIVSCINSTPLGNFMHCTVSNMWNGLLSLDAREILIMLLNRDVNKYKISPSPVFEADDFCFSCAAVDSTTVSEEFFDLTRYKSSAGGVSQLTCIGSTVDVGSFFADSHPNTIVWTDQSNNKLSKRVPAFKQGYMYSLNTEDDSEILGGTAFQNTLIVSKKNSLWRLTFEDGGGVTAQRIQSNVGSYSHNNMPSTSDEMYLIHPTGVYSTDGTSVAPIFKLNQLFQDRVNKDPYLLSRTAGYVDPQQKNLFLGTPYSSNYISNVSTVDGQFNYSFNDGVLGWNVNIGLDALKWTNRDDQYYFASTRGRVFRMRSEKYLTKYRDGESAIGMALSTRFLTIGSGEANTDGQRFKFWRNVMFQFSGTSDFAYSTFYSTNYDTTQTAMETYPIAGAVLEAGAKWYGNQKLLRTLRETVAQRVQSISFTLTEGSIDTDAPIYSVAVEGFQTNTRLVNQKATPGSRT